MQHIIYFKSNQAMYCFVSQTDSYIQRVSEIQSDVDVSILKKKRDEDWEQQESKKENLMNPFKDLNAYIYIFKTKQKRNILEQLWQKL